MDRSISGFVDRKAEETHELNQALELRVNQRILSQLFRILKILLNTPSHSLNGGLLA